MAVRGRAPCTASEEAVVQSGLLSVQQQGRDKRYVLATEPLGAAKEWIEEIGARSEERLLRLKAMLEQEYWSIPARKKKRQDLEHQDACRFFDSSFTSHRCLV